MVEQTKLFMEQTTAPELQEHILTELEPRLERAGLGKRFANYLIDVVAFAVFLMVIGFVSALISPAAIEFWEDVEANPIVDRLLSMLLYGLFMGLQETIFKGGSIGKMITGTRAVREDGSRIDARTAFLRGLSRMVPFEPLSALGRSPWHDSWTKTVVIDLRKSTLPE